MNPDVLAPQSSLWLLVLLTNNPIFSSVHVNCMLLQLLNIAMGYCMEDVATGHTRGEVRPISLVDHSDCFIHNPLAED